MVAPVVDNSVCIKGSIIVALLTIYMKVGKKNFFQKRCNIFYAMLLID